MFHSDWLVPTFVKEILPIPVIHFTWLMFHKWSPILDPDNLKSFALSLEDDKYSRERKKISEMAHGQ